MKKLISLLVCVVLVLGLSACTLEFNKGNDVDETLEVEKLEQENKELKEELEKLKEEDFYRDGHKVIFKAIREMFSKDMAVDLVTLLEYLKSTDTLEKAGGVTYISEVKTTNEYCMEYIRSGELSRYLEVRREQHRILTTTTEEDVIIPEMEARYPMINMALHEDPNMDRNIDRAKYYDKNIFRW